MSIRGLRASTNAGDRYGVKDSALQDGAERGERLVFGGTAAVGFRLLHRSTHYRALTDAGEQVINAVPSCGAIYFVGTTFACRANHRQEPPRRTYMLV